MNRLSVIQQAVNKFCGYLAQVELRLQSGLTEQDNVCSNFDFFFFFFFFFLSIFLVYVLFIPKDSNYVEFFDFSDWKGKPYVSRDSRNNISL
jgi:hypothetical protein